VELETRGYCVLLSAGFLRWGASDLVAAGATCIVGEEGTEDGVRNSECRELGGVEYLDSRDADLRGLSAA